ncbi:hypothetical protein H476_2860 [[Clostridium] sordellii VPI 9048]|nr:hypothetical protein H476_2860 [[Clostridium] sordellii VPI 9048] [Paeniclostridium sordellii VPI 9048]
MEDKIDMRKYISSKLRFLEEIISEKLLIKNKNTFKIYLNRV